MSLKVYKLRVPQILDEEVKRVAQGYGVSTEEFVKACLKAGLLMAKIDEHPTDKIMVRSTNSDGVMEERELVLFRKKESGDATTAE